MRQLTHSLCNCGDFSCTSTRYTRTVINPNWYDKSNGAALCSFVSATNPRGVCKISWNWSGSSGVLAPRSVPKNCWQRRRVQPLKYSRTEDDLRFDLRAPNPFRCCCCSGSTPHRVYGRPSVPTYTHGLGDYILYKEPSAVTKPVTATASGGGPSLLLWFLSF